MGSPLMLGLLECSHSADMGADGLKMVFLRVKDPIA